LLQKLVVFDEAGWRRWLKNYNNLKDIQFEIASTAADGWHAINGTETICNLVFSWQYSYHVPDGEIKFLNVRKVL
jgi:hypothetical protein